MVTEVSVTVFLFDCVGVVTTVQIVDKSSREPHFLSEVKSISRVLNPQKKDKGVSFI